mmetsp:Transcript_75223/g.190801  ORF Transcript_75223/g.190801 Transcript_75223/m.190801 type:complete len:299 (+) Transcript_75223:544-1440(+)
MPCCRGAGYGPAPGGAGLLKSPGNPASASSGGPPVPRPLRNAWMCGLPEGVTADSGTAALPLPLAPPEALPLLPKPKRSVLSVPALREDPGSMRSVTRRGRSLRKICSSTLSAAAPAPFGKPHLGLEALFKTFGSVGCLRPPLELGEQRRSKGRSRSALSQPLPVLPKSCRSAPRSAFSPALPAQANEWRSPRSALSPTLPTAPAPAEGLPAAAAEWLVACGPPGAAAEAADETKCFGWSCEERFGGSLARSSFFCACCCSCASCSVVSAARGIGPVSQGCSRTSVELWRSSSLLQIV